MNEQQHLLARILDVIAERFDRLRATAADLTDDQIAVELSDFLPPTELVGLALSFRAELAKLR